MLGTERAVPHTFDDERSRRRVDERTIERHDGDVHIRLNQNGELI